MEHKCMKNETKARVNTYSLLGLLSWLEDYGAYVTPVGNIKFLDQWNGSSSESLILDNVDPHMSFTRPDHLHVAGTVDTTTINYGFSMRKDADHPA